MLLPRSPLDPFPSKKDYIIWFTLPVKSLPMILQRMLRKLEKLVKKVAV